MTQTESLYLVQVNQHLPKKQNPRPSFLTRRAAKRLSNKRDDETLYPQGRLAACASPAAQTAAAGAELVRECFCCMAPRSQSRKENAPHLSPPRPATLKLQKSIRLAMLPSCFDTLANDTPGKDGPPRETRMPTQFKLADFEDLREISTISDNAKPKLNLSGTVRRLDLVPVACITACPLCLLSRPFLPAGRLYRNDLGLW